MIGLVLFAFAASAQNGLILEGKFKVDGGSNNGAKIIVEKDGKRVQTKEGTSRFEIELDFQAVYLVSFEKDGFVSKKLRFDTHVPEDRIEYGFEIFEFTVEIFEQYDDVNMVIFNQPVGKISFSDLIDEFDYDTDYTKSIQAQIDDTMDEIEDKKEELADQQAAEAKAQEDLNKQVENLTSTAQKLEDQGKVDEAIQKLKEANDLKEDPTTQKKIQELEKKKEEQQQQQQKQDNFNKIIADAEAAMAQGDLEGAKKLFAQADGVIGGDPKVKAGLDKVEKQIAQAAKEEEEAKAAAAAAAEEEKKKAQAEELFAEAEALLAEGKYDEAKAKLAAAGELTDDKRVDSIAKAIADEQDRIAQEAAAAAANQQKHDNLIAQGNEALAAGEFDKAKSAFEEASGLIDGSAEAAKGLSDVSTKQEEAAAAQAAAEAEAAAAEAKKQEEAAAAEAKKQEEFDKLFGEAQASMDAGDYSGARAKLEQAKAIKDDPKVGELGKAIDAKEKEVQKAQEEEQKAAEAYNKLIADGNSALGSGDLEGAQKAFEEAKGLKDDSPEADQGLASVQSKRDEIAAKEAAAAAEEAKKKEEFENLISDAQSKLASGDLNGAKSAFTAAGELFEDKRVDAGLKAISDAEAEEKRQAEEAAAAEQEFNNLVAEGDQLKDGGESAKAIAKYEQALELKNDPSIQGKIDELKSLVSQQEQEAARAEAEAEQQKQYEDLIAKADKAFESDDLEKAKELYQSAAQVSSEDYPSSQLDAIQKIYDDRAAAEKAQEEQLAADEAAKKAAEEEAARLAAEEEANKAADAEAKKLAEEEAAAKAAADEAAKKLAEEEAAAKAAADEEAKRLADEEAKRLAEQQAANETAEEEAKRLAEEEASRLATEEEAAKKAAQEAARKAAEEEAAKKAAEEEAARLAAEQAAKSQDEESQSQESEMDDAYATLMEEGQELFRKNKLEAARDKFAEAMSYKPGDDAAKGKILQINSILDKQEEEKKKAEEAARAAAAAQQEEPEESAPQTETVVLGDVRVGEEASLTARLSEDEKFDGMMRRAEIQQEQFYKEEEQKQLRDQYPRRKTVETEQAGNSVITWVYINYGEFVTVYKRVKHNWGGEYFFIDGQATNRRFWEHETQ